MEMRARAETGMSQDLTPPIPPLAASLYDSFLPSHCSCCFLLIPPTLGADDGGPSSDDASRVPCSCRGTVLRYCSARCRDADLEAHASSGECQLLRLIRLHHSQLSHWCPDDTVDLRAAIRLLHSFQKQGLLPPSRRRLERIGGLMTGNREESGEGCDVAERIKEGGALISRARKLCLRAVKEGYGVRDDDCEAEEAVLWAVATNAVEVQIDERSAIGVAVYGPQFSWFNHSCSPNACYRFELLKSECSISCESEFLVYPVGTETRSEVTGWALDEGEQNQGLYGCGPRIVVRSILPIKQGEEVCITYTDLLQPTATRHSDLWSRYGFTCRCKRCSSNPEVYADLMLCETGFDLDTADFNFHLKEKDGETEGLSNIINPLPIENLSRSDLEAYCSYVEDMLTNGFKDELLQPPDSSPTRFKLQPLHHISLRAYIMLASLYRIRGCNLETSNCKKDILEEFNMNRAAASYSLLLAGITNHFMFSEPSLITTSTVFWISSGETLLVLLRKIIHRWQANLVDVSAFDHIFGDAQTAIPPGSSLSWEDFNVMSSRCFDCILGISSKSWLFMASGIQCLTDVKNPIDFSGLGKKYVNYQVIVDESIVPSVGHPMNKDAKCIGCKCEANVHLEEVSENLYRLAVHCIVYGGFLATICYGYRSYWTERVRMLLFHDGL